MILYALSSLLFAGVNDVVFKKYGEKPRPVGYYIGIIGVIWTLFFLGMGMFRNSLVFDRPALLIGAWSGITSFASNVLYIETMRKMGAGISSTVYRLNLVFVALLAWLFLSESYDAPKIAGLLCAVLSVFLFSRAANSGESKIVLKLLMILVLASILRALMGVSYKVASIAGASNEAFLAVSGFFWLVLGIVYGAVRERRARVNISVLRFAALSGFLVCGVVLFMKIAVNRGDASVAVTISQLSFLVTFPLAVAFLKEKFDAWKFLAVMAAVACIFLFAYGRT